MGSHPTQMKKRSKDRHATSAAATVRTARKPIRKRAFGIAAVGLAVLTAFAMWTRWDSQRTKLIATHTFERRSPTQFAGTLTTTIMRYDRTANVAEVTVDVAVSKLSDGDIKKLSFSPTTVTWMTWEKREEKNPVTSESFDFDGEYSEAPGAPARTKVGKQTTLTLPIRKVRQDSWFPFDEWAIELRPLACVDAPQGDCTLARDRDVHFDQVTVRLADTIRTDQNYVLRTTEDENGRLEIVVQRQVFIRVLPTLFFLIACGYLYYVIRYETPRDQVMKSLGTIAALWGLRGIVVPKQILVFPTLLDYALLVLIALTFLATVIKFETIGEEP